MNWDAIGAIGEVVGAIAVVISLLYLATQIRASARQSAATIELNTIAKFTDLLEVNVQSERVSRLLVKALSGKKLTPDEEFSYLSQLTRVFQSYAITHIAYENKQLSEKQYKNYSKSLRHSCATFPHAQEYLQDWLEQFDPGLKDVPMFAQALAMDTSEKPEGHWDHAVRIARNAEDSET